MYNIIRTSQVADHLGKQDVSQTWLILKLLYCGGNSDCSRLGLIQTNIPPRHSAGSRLSTTQVRGQHGLYLIAYKLFCVVDYNIGIRKHNMPQGLGLGGVVWVLA